MSPYIGLCLLIAYLLLSIEVYLTTYTIGAFHLSFWSFGPTELRLLLCIGNLASSSTVRWGRSTGVTAADLRYRRRDRDRRDGADADLVGGAAHAAALQRRAPAVKPLAFRWLKFNFVGAVGIVVQLARSATADSRIPRPLPGRDGDRGRDSPCCTISSGTNGSRGRTGRGGPGAPSWRRLLRFHAGNGLVSIAGNLVLMRLFVGGMGLQAAGRQCAGYRHLFAPEFRGRRMVCLSRESRILR